MSLLGNSTLGYAHTQGYCLYIYVQNSSVTKCRPASVLILIYALNHRFRIRQMMQQGRPFLFASNFVHIHHWLQQSSKRSSIDARWLVNRCGFRISSRGWQRHLQEVAKISQGVAKKLRAIPFLLAFFAVLQPFTNLRPLFYMKKYIKITFKKFLFCLLSLFPRNFLCLGGAETSWNGQGVASPSPETLKGWRGGPRRSLKSPLDTFKGEWIRIGQL